MPPTVSVIIPAYNAERYLSAALDSVLNQTLPPHEVIVVDDGSTDGTAEICHRYGNRIVYIQQENQGQAGARNTAIKAATGAFVALHDADDLCSPERLERQAQALVERPDAVACFTGHWVFDEQGETGRYPGKPQHANSPPEHFAAWLLVHPITCMFRRAAVPDVQFPRGVNLAEDMIFMALLRRHGDFVILPDVLFGYRRHSTQVTARASAMDSLNMRVKWARENAAGLWPELNVEEFEALVWRAFAEGVGGHYWARRKAEFLHLRSLLREQWPRHLPTPPEAKLRWYPDVLWRLKGLVDAARGRRAT